MTTYDSSSIEVLTGLEPVRKRPGMYTTTERPNHLAQEVIDNSADAGARALASLMASSNAEIVANHYRFERQGKATTEIWLRTDHATSDEID